MCRSICRTALLASLVATAGCRLTLPTWLDPGTLPQQQQRASLHDPYAVDDWGPPIEGMRPRNYQKPRSEPVREKWYTDNVLNRWTAPPPPLTVQPGG